MVEEAYAGDIIGVFDPGIFLLEILLKHLQNRSVMKESRLLHRSILQESVR